MSATNIQGTSALLRGTVNPEGLATTYRFEYVREASFEANQPDGFAAAVSTRRAELSAASTPREVTAAITGLAPSTTYRFRLRAESSAGSSFGEKIFSTSSGFGFLPGLEGFNAFATQGGILPNHRAGSITQALIKVNFKLANESDGQPGDFFTDGDVKSLSIDLPLGLMEYSAGAPRCSSAAFVSDGCPAESQVGNVKVSSPIGGGSTQSLPVYSLDPPPGALSEFGFNPYGEPITFSVHLREVGSEYGLTFAARNIPQLFDLKGFELRFGRGGAMIMPLTCSAPLRWTATADSWQQPGKVGRAVVTQFESGPPTTLEGCSEVPFHPLPRLDFTSSSASSSTGLDFDFGFQEQGSAIKTAVVEMPPGVTINPSVGAGLRYCTPAQYAAETFSSPPGAGCPEDAKIGDFQVLSPLSDEPISGALFLAAPYDNPVDALLGLYLVAKAPERGILVKVEGRLTPDQETGQLTATFENLPQIFYSHLKVHFRAGQRSPLATPASCGTYSTIVRLTPWLNPDRVVSVEAPLVVSSGVGGEPCPEGTPPFNPQSQAGSVNSSAGSYSPFYLHLTREDTEQEITSYSTTLPPGLTGKLAGIPYCPDANVEAAKHRDGFGEAERPSCPEASKIGHTVAGYGVGSVLAFAPGGLYLAGPFHGAPFSIVAIDSATVGPFDLGVIVIRSAIKVDPRTAQVSIDSAGSDPIPHILDGIPIHLRDVRVYISRPDFTLNPTNCDPFTVASQLQGSGASFGNPGDVADAIASSPYQASNCGALSFKPRLKLRLRGGTGRGEYPALRAEVRPRPGDANIAGASVALPPSEFFAQGHIRGICTAVQYAREACPADSVYGSARAFSSLLGQPLEGKVYLRSSNHPLPDLVAALRGGGNGLTIDVVGRIGSINGGLRATYETLPDAPVSKFVMNLRGGRRGLLVNSEDVCKATKPANARFFGQNDLEAKLHPKIEAKCPKKGKRRVGKKESRRCHSAPHLTIA